MFCHDNQTLGRRFTKAGYVAPAIINRVIVGGKKRTTNHILVQDFIHFVLVGAMHPNGVKEKMMPIQPLAKMGFKR